MVPHSPVSFVPWFPVLLTLKADQQCACAYHVTPSFRTDDTTELQFNTHLIF